MRKIILTFAGLLFTVSVFSQAYWSLTGNAGTTTSNFVGTTDTVPLIFKVNNEWAGYSGYSDNYNVSFGYRTFNPLNLGESNVALGTQALRTNTTGSGNVAIGRWANEYNLTGSHNVTIGFGTSALQHDTVSYTVAIGALALENNKKKW